MPEPELHTRKITKTVPACESGRHVAHPGDTCEETDDLQAVVDAYFQRCLAEAYAAAEQVHLFGNGQQSITQPTGFISLDGPEESTPVERALAILDSELRRCPLYEAGPPAVYGPRWKARP